MSEIEKLNMIAEWQEQHKQLIEDLDNSKKRIADLEKEISVLLSCKNCSENKGGLLCQKEYEDKCLAQKIQYIKELKEENAELKEKLNFSTQYYQGEKAKEQLTKAKDILRRLMASQPTPSSMYEEADLVNWREANKGAEQFLNNELKK